MIGGGHVRPGDPDQGGRSPERPGSASDLEPHETAPAMIRRLSDEDLETALRNARDMVELCRKERRRRKTGTQVRVKTAYCPWCSRMVPIYTGHGDNAQFAAHVQKCEKAPDSVKGAYRQ